MQVVDSYRREPKRFLDPGDSLQKGAVQRATAVRRRPNHQRAVVAEPSQSIVRRSKLRANGGGRASGWAAQLGSLMLGLTHSAQDGISRPSLNPHRSRRRPAADYVPPKTCVTLRLMMTGELSVPGGSSPTTMRRQTGARALRLRSVAPNL
jgi:hypothetical protein